MQSYCKGGAIEAPQNLLLGATSKGESTMTKLVRCTCGVELRSPDERELIGQVQEHATEAHELQLSDEQVRAMMEVDQQSSRT